MLAKSKLNSIDTLISQALIDMDITHEEFITILKENNRYEVMKDNLRNKNGESYEIMRFNSVKSRIFFSGAYIKVKYYRVFCINKKNFFSGTYIKVKYYRAICINKFFFLVHI